MDGKKAPRKTIMHHIGSGESILLKLDVQPHPTNSTKYVLWIDRPDFTIDVSILKSFNKPDSRDKSSIDLYKSYVQDILVKYNISNDEDKVVKADELIAFESFLANSTVDQVTYNNWKLSLKVMTIAELDKLSPLFNWKGFLTTISFMSGAGYVFNPETEVVIRDFNYIKALTSIESLHPVQNNGREIGKDEEKESFSTETINNYIKFYLVTTYQFMVDKDSIETEAKILSKLRSENFISDYNSKSRCLNLLRSYARELVGRIFVDSTKPPRQANYNGLEEMAKLMKEQLMHQIEESSGFSEKSKEILIHRLNKLVLRTGYPGWISNDHVLEKWFVFEVSIIILRIEKLF